jgi:hypothetical protein
VIRRRHFCYVTPQLWWSGSSAARMPGRSPVPAFSTRSGSSRRAGPPPPGTRPDLHRTRPQSQPSGRPVDGRVQPSIRFRPRQSDQCPLLYSVHTKPPFVTATPSVCFGSGFTVASTVAQGLFYSRKLTWIDSIRYGTKVPRVEAPRTPFSEDTTSSSAAQDERTSLKSVDPASIENVDSGIAPMELQASNSK